MIKPFSLYLTYSFLVTLHHDGDDYDEMDEMYDI